MYHKSPRYPGIRVDLKELDQLTDYAYYTMFEMPFYRPYGYRGYLDYYDRPHPLYHPYDGLFYGSRWYDYPPSLYARDYTYRVPPVAGLPRARYRAASDYGYTYPHVYQTPDPYGIKEPKYHMLFNDELKSIPKYSRYNTHPLKMYY